MILKKIINLSFILLAISANCFACIKDGTDNASAYARLLYPDGLPKKLAYFDNVDKTAVFKIHSEVKLSSGNNKIFGLIYSIESPESGARDSLHQVFLAVLSADKSNQCKVVSKNDITNKITTFLEEAGVFWGLESTMEVVPLKKVNILHVSLSSVLSGTGGIRSTSDIIYIIDSKSKDYLTELLYLPNMYSYGVDTPTQRPSCLVPWIVQQADGFRVVVTNEKKVMVNEVVVSGQPLKPKVISNNANKSSVLSSGKDNIRLNSLIFGCMKDK